MYFFRTEFYLSSLSSLLNLVKGRVNYISLNLFYSNIVVHNFALQKISGTFVGRISSFHVWLILYCVGGGGDIIQLLIFAFLKWLPNIKFFTCSIIFVFIRLWFYSYLFFNSSFRFLNFKCQNKCFKCFSELLVIM